MSTATAIKRKVARKSSISSYDRFKRSDGQVYTGMQVGRSHKWYYDKGEWKETKITPDLWQISYAVTKRRAGKAPAGSGVPVGTGYHWYIFAHQTVKKLNANDYTTEMSGLKFKLAHKRAAKEAWSASSRIQRRNLAAFLKKMIVQLESEPVPIDIEYKGARYKGEGVPVLETCSEGVCHQLDISLNGEQLGIIRNTRSGWKMDLVKDKGLVNAIGEEILLWYE